MTVLFHKQSRTKKVVRRRRGRIPNPFRKGVSRGSWASFSFWFLAAVVDPDDGRWINDGRREGQATGRITNDPVSNNTKHKAPNKGASIVTHTAPINRPERWVQQPPFGAPKNVRKIAKPPKTVTKTLPRHSNIP